MVLIFPNEYLGWLGEYPWGNVFTELKKDDKGYDIRGKKIKMPLTITSYSYYNELVNPTIIKLIPSPRLINVLDLTWAGESFDYLDKDKNLVCWNPSGKLQGTDTLLVDPYSLTNKLESKKLDLVWTVAANKSLKGSCWRKSPGELYISGVYHSNKNGIEGEITIKEPINYTH